MITTKIIAEAGVNHNGSIDMALELIDKASEAGADIVKFQTFKADQLANKSAPKADYQVQTTGNDESQYQMLKKLELTYEHHEQLIAHCQQRSIQFLSSPFDLASIDLLTQEFGLTLLKIPSGEITNGPLLLKAAQTGCDIIISSGMSMLGEVERALGILAYGYLDWDDLPCLQAFQRAYCSTEGQQILQQKVTLLHCTSQYPAPVVEVNLRAMDALQAAFGLSIGYSDHTEGIAIPLAAVARGATTIEKHFTLDRQLPGPDHRASLEPKELADMVQGIRQIELALGHGRKMVVPSEQSTQAVARKSLAVQKAIKKGEQFTASHLMTLRPGSGIAPIYYWDYLAKVATRDYDEHELIEL